MKKSGCSYTGGACQPAVEACQGCSRTIEVESGWYCAAAPEPALKWKTGVCNMATHVKSTDERPAESKINPLKASKRASRRK
jgi:hypothetical protein